VVAAPAAVVAAVTDGSGRRLPPDPELPGVADLLADAPEVLAGFLAAQRWALHDARPVQVLYRPGRSCNVRYQARARHPDGALRALSLVVETRARPRTPSSPPASFGERYRLPNPVTGAGPYLAWVFPYDPSLPGLIDAAWGPAVRETLGRTGRRATAVAVQPLRYRPRRRAVFHYLTLDRGCSDVLFGKALPPAKAEAILDAAPGLRGRRRSRRRLRVSLPLAHNTDGALLFARLDGRSLRDLLLTDGSLPAPERLAGVLDDLPRLAGNGGPPTPGSPKDPFRMAEHARTLLTRVMPEAAADVHRAAGHRRASAARRHRASRPARTRRPVRSAGLRWRGLLDRADRYRRPRSGRSRPRRRELLRPPHRARRLGARGLGAACGLPHARA
jgi:hypothetical protein